jgi:RNA polymerase sigma-70 factor (ECF subfamily)
VSASISKLLGTFLAPTDEQLMWRAQMEDDAEAFADLVSRWQDPIRRLCARLTGDAHRAEDLAQEVFAKLFLRRKSFRQGSKLSTYLWRVALNHCYNDLRRPVHRCEARLEGGETGEAGLPDRFASADPAPDEALATSEVAQAVQRAVAQLPEQYRTIVILRHYENLKFREIADVLELPEGTVKTRMTEALSELARRLRAPLDWRVAPPPGRRSRPSERLVV